MLQNEVNIISISLSYIPYIYVNYDTGIVIYVQCVQYEIIYDVDIVIGSTCAIRVLKWAA